MHKKPDFIIAGTQKGGTTWVEHSLAQHPGIYTPRKQIHYFDRNFSRGIDWYISHFDVATDVLCGEKTTEYFDVTTATTFSKRLMAECPDTKIIISLRNPVNRAYSALGHTVRSCQEPIPDDSNALLFEDFDRPLEQSFRYIKRGCYSNQLKDLYRNIPESNVLVLIFEEDIVKTPRKCIKKILDFLNLDEFDPKNPEKPVNQLRLSRSAIKLSNSFSGIPYSRHMIRRIDRLLPSKPWQPSFSQDTTNKLKDYFHGYNQELYEMLGRESILQWNEK